MTSECLLWQLLGGVYINLVRGRKGIFLKRFYFDFGLKVLAQGMTCWAYTWYIQHKTHAQKLASAPKQGVFLFSSSVWGFFWFCCLFFLNRPQQYNSKCPPVKSQLWTDESLIYISGNKFISSSLYLKIIKILRLKEKKNWILPREEVKSRKFQPK